MASSDILARLRYLNDSAHLLATTAPATSRHLILRCNALMFERELETSETQTLKACGACGTIMILGWEGTLQTEGQPSRRKKAPQKGQDVKHTKALIYNCKTCGRKTRFALGTPPQANKQKSGSSNSRSMSTIQTLPKPSLGSSAPEAKLSSKKRAKTRKRGGLEALLAAKKAGPETSGFGLNLMDFMKKS
jgi:RNase P subunit RPR2